jgi:hypothetical protein
MSNRTLVELNHDYCPKDQELKAWAYDVQMYMRSGTKQYLPVGVTFKHMRHHSEPDPMRAVELLRRIIEDLPAQRDWLDPVIEREAKDLLKGL